MARLSRAAYAVVWVNPLKGHPDYQPLAGGMRAALPYVDRFLSGHNLASLEELGGRGDKDREEARSVREVLADIERWRAQGERVALATVIATRKSAPRPVGAKLAVSEGGEMAGSVSGGCVENEVFGHACEVLDGAQPQLLKYGISDELALTVGLPCGGEIDVFVDAPNEELLDRLKRVVETDERAVLFSVVEGEGLGSELLVTEAGERIGAGPDEAVARFDEVLRAGRNGSSTSRTAAGLRGGLRAAAAPPRDRRRRHGRERSATRRS